MTTGHQVVVVPDDRDSAALHGSRVDGGELPNVVAVSDEQARQLAAVGQILRRKADGCEGIKMIAGSEFRMAGDDTVTLDDGSGPDADMLADNRIGTDGDVVGQFRFGVHSGCRINLRHCSRSSPMRPIRDFTG